MDVYEELKEQARQAALESIVDTDQVYSDAHFELVEGAISAIQALMPQDPSMEWVIAMIYAQPDVLDFHVSADPMGRAIAKCVGDIIFFEIQDEIFDEAKSRGHDLPAPGGPPR